MKTLTKLFLAWIVCGGAQSLVAAIPGRAVDFNPRTDKTNPDNDSQWDWLSSSRKAANFVSDAKRVLSDTESSDTYIVNCPQPRILPVPQYMLTSEPNYNDADVQEEIRVFRQQMMDGRLTTQPQASSMETLLLDGESAGFVMGGVTWYRTPDPDFDDSGCVDSLDLAAFSASWLDSYPNYNANHDLNKDGIIDLADFAAFAAMWLHNPLTPALPVAAPYKDDHENCLVNSDLNGQNNYATYFSQPGGWSQVVEDFQDDSRFQYVTMYPGSMIEKNISSDFESSRFLIRPGDGATILVMNGPNIVAGMKFVYGFPYGRIQVYHNGQWVISDRTWLYSPHWIYGELKMDFQTGTYKAYYILEDVPQPVSYYGPQGHTNIFKMNASYQGADKFVAYSGQDDWFELDTIGSDSFDSPRHKFELTEPNPQGMSLNRFWPDYLGLGGQYSGITSNFVKVHICDALSAFVRNPDGSIQTDPGGLPYFYWNRWKEVAEIHQPLMGDLFDSIDTSTISPGLYCLAFTFYNQYNELLIDGNENWFWYVNDFIEVSGEIVDEAPTKFQLAPKKMTLPKNYTQELFSLKRDDHSISVQMAFDSRNPVEGPFGKGTRLCLRIDGWDVPSAITEVFEGGMTTQYKDINNIPTALTEEYSASGTTLFYPVQTDPVSDATVRYAKDYDPNRWPDPNDDWPAGITRITESGNAVYQKVSPAGLKASFASGFDMGYIPYGLSSCFRNHSPLVSVVDQYAIELVAVTNDGNRLTQIHAAHHRVEVDYSDDTHIREIRWYQNDKLKMTIPFLFQSGQGLSFGKLAAREPNSIIDEESAPDFSIYDPNFFDWQSNRWQFSGGKLAAVLDVNDIAATPLWEAVYDGTALLEEYIYSDPNDYRIKTYDYDNQNQGNHTTTIYNGMQDGDADPNLLSISYVVQDPNGRLYQDSQYIQSGLVNSSDYAYVGLSRIPYSIRQEMTIGDSTDVLNKFTTYDKLDRPLTIAEGEPNGIIEETVWHERYEGLYRQRTVWQYPGCGGIPKITRVIYGNQDGSYNADSPVPVIALQLKTYSTDPNNMVWLGESYTYQSGRKITKQMFSLVGNPADDQVVAYPKKSDELFTMEYDQNGYLCKMHMDGNLVFRSINDDNGNPVLTADHTGNVVLQRVNGFDLPYYEAKIFDPNGMQIPDAAFNEARYAAWQPVSGTRKHYNDRLLLGIEKLPWGEVIDYEYTVGGKVKSQRHYMNGVWLSENSVEYNGGGLPIAESQQDFASGHLAEIFRSYDGMDKEILVSEFFFDGSNTLLTNSTSQVNCFFGPYDIYTYGSDSQEMHVRQAYTKKGKVSQVTLDPEGQALTTTVMYDNHGNQIRVQDPDGWVTYSDFGPLGLSAVYYPVLDPAPKESAMVHYRIGYQSKDKMDMQAAFNRDGSLGSLKFMDNDPLDRLRSVAQPNTAALMADCYNRYAGTEVFDPNMLPADPNLAKLTVDNTVFEDSGDLFNRHITTACGKEVLALLQNGHYENVRYPDNVWSQNQCHNPDGTLTQKTVVSDIGTPESMQFTTGQYGKPILQEYPDGGSVGLTWDMFGSVSHADDNRNQGHTGDVDQVADHHGNIRETRQGDFQGSFDYTSDGRPRHIVVKRQGTTVYDVEYRYDNGRLDEIFWFGRLVLKYQRDGRGNPIQTIYSFDGTLTDTMAMGTTFDAENRPSSFNLSGVPCAFGWNAIGRDGRGFITGAVETFLDQTRYLSGSYDPMGRLLSWGWQGYSWNYGFDLDGNITSDGQHGFSNTGLLLSGRDDGQSLSWDKNGQLLTSSWNTPLNMTWDYDGRLRSAGDYNVYYNPFGIRTQMTGPLSDTGFFADPAANDLVLWDNMSNTLKTCVIYDDLGNPMALVNGGKLHFLIHGNNRDVRLVISEDKELESYYTYSPYGQMIPDLSNIGSEINPFGAFAYMTTPWNDYYVKARYYSPSLRIFYSADPIWASMNDPQQVFPRIQYCGNNPINFIDPSGKIVPVVAYAIKLAVAAAAVYVSYLIYDWFYPCHGDGLTNSNITNNDITNVSRGLSLAVKGLGEEEKSPPGTMGGLWNNLAKKNLRPIGELGIVYIDPDNTEGLTEGEYMIYRHFESVPWNANHPKARTHPHPTKTNNSTGVQWWIGSEISRLNIMRGDLDAETQRRAQENN